MERFEEVNKSYTVAEAIREAQRCLLCKVPQCQKGCPVSNKIPEWIAELGKGNFGNAIKIIRERSNLPAVCGRVCAKERQCEGHCILNKKGEHIHIGKLERFVADFDADAGLDHENVPEKNKGKVAVIGSGPAGLTIAADLARKGYAVEVYEMEEEAGGVLLYGIPEYRLPKEVVRREVRSLEALGVAIHCNVTIGVDYTVDDLFAMGFDAIFIGTGAGLPLPLPTEGMDAAGVCQALHFLRKVQLYNSGHIDRKEVIVGDGDVVFVIGGGNTAMDSARTALRMGSKEVTVVYRRTLEKMRALRSEYEEALEEGVRFLWESNVVKVNAGEGSSLRSLIIETNGVEKEYPADHLIQAVGSAPAARIVSTTEGIDVDGRGYVLTREMPYGMTSREGVFAGGDVSDRPATVVHAMSDAKKVAQGIDQYVSALKLMQAIRK
ncbi:MAG: NAD(P)-dependent oxidoreductase [Muribaculaceae bacterium]|nr:NAD(P)-dependent oxidoreductase [Muribaculaceae bacterium]